MELHSLIERDRPRRRDRAGVRRAAAALAFFLAAGFPVIGFDVDSRKVDSLRAGRNYLKHLGEGCVREMSASR